jgi:hypothetical protein
VSGEPPEKAAGHCNDCGEHTDAGRVLGHVDQGSGPGFTVVQCSRCEMTPPKRRKYQRKRTDSGP